MCRQGGGGGDSIMEEELEGEEAKESCCQAAAHSGERKAWSVRFARLVHRVTDCRGTSSTNEASVAVEHCRRGGVKGSRRDTATRKAHTEGHEDASSILIRRHGDDGPCCCSWRERSASLT